MIVFFVVWTASDKLYTYTPLVVMNEWNLQFFLLSTSNQSVGSLLHSSVF